jgi:hypothetical protein
MRLLCYNFFLFVLSLSCQDKAASSNRSLNDTARIIEIALQEGTSVGTCLLFRPCSRNINSVIQFFLSVAFCLCTFYHLRQVTVCLKS